MSEQTELDAARFEWTVSESGHPSRHLRRNGKYIGLVQAEYAQLVVDKLNAVARATPSPDADVVGELVAAAEALELGEVSTFNRLKSALAAYAATGEEG